MHAVVERPVRTEEAFALTSSGDFTKSLPPLLPPRVFLVLDTNILLAANGLDLVKRMRLLASGSKSRKLDVEAVLPWIVLKELDGLKNVWGSSSASSLQALGSLEPLEAGSGNRDAEAPALTHTSVAGAANAVKPLAAAARSVLAFLRESMQTGGGVGGGLGQGTGREDSAANALSSPPSAVPFIRAQSLQDFRRSCQESQELDLVADDKVLQCALQLVDKVKETFPTPSQSTVVPAASTNALSSFLVILVTDDNTLACKSMGSGIPCLGFKEVRSAVEACTAATSSLAETLMQCTEKQQGCSPHLISVPEAEKRESDEKEDSQGVKGMEIDMMPAVVSETPAEMMAPAPVPVVVPETVQKPAFKFKLNFSASKFKPVTCPKVMPMEPRICTPEAIKRQEEEAMAILALMGENDDELDFYMPYDYEGEDETN